MIEEYSIFDEEIPNRFPRITHLRREFSESNGRCGNKTDSKPQDPQTKVDKTDWKSLCQDCSGYDDSCERYFTN